MRLNEEQIFELGKSIDDVEYRATIFQR